MEYTIGDAAQVIRNKLCASMTIPNHELKPIGSGQGMYWVDLPESARLYLVKESAALKFCLTYPKTINVESPAIAAKKAMEPKSAIDLITKNSSNLIPSDMLEARLGIPWNCQVTSKYDQEFLPVVEKGVEISKSLIQSYLDGLQKPRIPYEQPKPAPQIAAAAPSKAPAPAKAKPSKKPKRKSKQKRKR